MSADGVSHVADVDGVQVLALRFPLHEYLVVEVVAEVGYKLMDTAHNLQHVQPLGSPAGSMLQYTGHTACM